MTNYERIKSMSVEELAEVLITYDGEYDDWWTSDCERWGTREDAIKHEAEWLLQQEGYDK